MAKKRRKRRPKKPLPVEIFCHATANWKAAAAVGRECNFPHPFKMPMVVLEIFSIELFIKCLIEMRHRTPPPEHDLETLLEVLSKRDKCKIEELFDSIVDHDHRLVRKVNLRSVLDRSKKFFNHSRYVFEGHKWKKDKQGWYGNEGFGDLLLAIRQYILQLHPEFELTAKSLLISR